MTYRVVLTDRAGTALGQVPADGLSYEHRLGGTGSCSLQIRLDHPVISGLDRSNLDTWATEVQIDIDGQVVFAGPVVDVDANGLGNAVSVKAAAAPHWLTRRHVLRDLAFVAADPAAVLAALVDYAQDPVEKGPHADARLVVNAPPTGAALTRTYLASERPQVGDLIQQLATSEPGFDLTVEYDQGVRVLRAHSPFAGVDADVPLVLGRNLTALSVKAPGDQLTTRVLAVGNGEGTDQVTATATAPDLEARYGVHEATLSGTDVKDTAALQALAAGTLQVRRPPVLVVGASYRVGPAAPYDLCDLGDRVLVQADRGWLRLSERLRVVARKVTVSASGTETVDLTFNTVLGEA